VDAAALGAGASPQAKHEEIVRLVDHHRATGEWRRTADGTGTGGDGLLVRAIMEFNGMDRDSARAAVGRLDKKLQAAMRASPELSPIIERLRVEKAPRGAKVDVAGVLAGLARAA
jgi:hypothetical protein